MNNISIALAGQPNCGKSTIFNMLTGARQHVANYPGITVEKKSGHFKIDDKNINLVDLPGTYSLTSFTQEELVTRNYIIDDNPDIIINVLDASNLEKSLYLTFQLIEMNKPMIIILNMMDAAKSLGYKIDSIELEHILQIPVIEATAKKGIGKKEIENAIIKLLDNMNDGISGYKIGYENIENKIDLISRYLDEKKDLTKRINSRWIALKLLEADKDVIDWVNENNVNIIASLRSGGKNLLDNEKITQQIIASCRYKHADEIVNNVVNRKNQKDSTLTDKIDNILCHKILGPLFLMIFMYLFFQAVIGFDAHIQPHWQKIIGSLRLFIIDLIPAESMIDDGILKTLIGLNIINGAFSLLSYIPMFFILFFLVGIMEDTGYMARIAFIMDRLLRAFGLHGQSVLPLLLGGVGMGGCAIPGIMATRAMKDEKAKLVTRLIVPILNCGAKIPFYLMITAAFFKENAGLVLIIFYLIIFIIVLIVAKILDKFIVSGVKSPFIMELPAYHMPTVSIIIKNAFTKVWMFVKKIVTVIVPFMAIMWVITYYPGLDEESEKIFNNKYEKALKKFEKKSGSDNKYLEYLNDEKSRLAFMKYSDKVDKKLRAIKSEKTESVMDLDDKFKKDNPKYFEAMLLGDESGIKDIDSFDNYRDDYGNNLKPIEDRYISELVELSIKEMNNNPEFYKIVSKGKIYLPKNEIKRIKRFYKEYKENIENIEENERIIEINNKFRSKNPLYYSIIKDGNIKIKKDFIEDKSAAKVEKSFNKGLIRETQKIKQDKKSKTIEVSLGGIFGKAIEPLTKLAGFDWRVNLAFISTFAAKENFVAVINGIFGIKIGDGGMLIGAPWTVLNGICMMIALALFPPCLPTLVLVKTETGKLKWMIFVIIYPIILGYLLSILIYQFGTMLNIGI